MIFYDRGYGVNVIYGGLYDGDFMLLVLFFFYCVLCKFKLGSRIGGLYDF